MSSNKLEARDIRRHLKTVTADVKKQVTKALEDELVVAYSGCVAEYFLFGVVYNLRMKVTESRLVSNIHDLVAELIEESNKEQDESPKYLDDFRRIAFLIEAHPGKITHRKIIRRVLKEFKDQRVSNIATAMLPSLRKNGKLAKAELQIMWEAFNSTTAGERSVSVH